MDPQQVLDIDSLQSSLTAICLEKRSAMRQVQRDTPPGSRSVASLVPNRQEDHAARVKTTGVCTSLRLGHLH